MASKWTRRDWLKAAGSLIPAAAFISCSKSSHPAAPPDAPPAGNFLTDVLMNHCHAPHALVVTTQEAMDAVQSGTSKTYSIQGMANHDHMVTISPAQFQALLDSQTPAFILSTMAVCHTHCCVVWVTGPAADSCNPSSAPPPAGSCA